MKRFASFFRKNLLISCLAILLVSCSMSTSTIPYSPTATPVSGGVTVVSDVESTHTPFPATMSPVVTITSTPTSTVTLTPSPTETPAVLPTLSPDEAERLILDLFQNNGGCLLPCFWGFTPGQTEWQTAERALTTFAYQISYGSPDGTFSDIPVGDSFVAWVYLYFPQISSAPISYAFRVQDGIITMIEAHILPTPSYALPAILSTYGQPTEVWLLTANAPREGFLGFSMRLFYSQHSFLLSYGTQGIIQNGKVQGCFSEPEKSLRLVAWSPQKEVAYTEALSGVHPPSLSIYDRPLEEATGMSLDAFYEAFRNPDDPLCLETPTGLWPGP